MTSATCNNCNRDAVIDWLPGNDGDPELWCFGCFIENYAAIDGSVVVRERRSGDRLDPGEVLAGEVTLDVRHEKPVRA
ncbi:MAG: hypothetical protein KGZ65_06180 [Sphingomonadales bacterium]|nr:hypothetical protein [Sphingomonadaceae bacterium]MBS3930807.1 hypothetical protein [Sphingomonadales bacterium]